MESEKVKDIKETLKRCGSGKDGCCWGCSLQDTQNIAKCTTILCEKALTLINELESENKQLLEENESLNGSWKMQLKKIAELEKEIEENAFYAKGYAQGIKNTYEVVVPDKLKQFAEMLKEKGKSTYDFFQCPTKENKVISFDDIDETLKEFMENV